MTASLPWHSAVRDILGMQEDVDPVRLTGTAWLSLDSSYWESRRYTVQGALIPGQTEDASAKPWEHWMPEGPGKNWNEITLYRRRRTVSSYDWFNNGSTYTDNFQLIRAEVPFYSGTKGGDGKDSMSKMADALIAANQKIIDNIGNNPNLDPQAFRDVADRLHNVWSYLVGDGQKQLNLMYKEIDDSGAGEGDAANAFAWAMHDMAFGMQTVAGSIKGDFLVDHNLYVNTDWSHVLEETATAVERFRDSMKEAWKAFLTFTDHNPNTLVDALLKSMERQTDDAYHVWEQKADKYTAGGYESWYFEFKDLLPQGSEKYDLIQVEGWKQLDLDLRKQWDSIWGNLDRDSKTATGNLIDAYDKLLAAFSRGVKKLTHLPYPNLKPPGDEGSNKPPPSLGNSEVPPPPENGGSDGNVPTADGSGSETPPLSEIGGSDGNVPTADGGGSGLPPSLDSGVSNGELPPPNSLVGGPDSSAGFNGPGVNGPGLDGSGVDGPGLDGSGGDGPGFLGAGGSGPGRAGVGSGGSGRSGVVAGDGSDAPSSLDPNAVGSDGFKGFDPGGFGSGGGLGDGGGPTQERPGFSLGPLGTPPAGYTPSPITNFPAGAVAGGAYASGGQNIGGLPGAMAIPTPAPDGGSGAMGGMGGMPFMPPMGSPGGGRDSEKDRERNTWLTEDEEVWGTDPEVTAAVIGRDDYEPEPDAQPTRQPSQPRKPQPTYQPTRGRGNR